MPAKTLFEKIWDAHVVRESNGTTLLYIDRHLVHEVTSPQAFEGLRDAGRRPRRTASILAVPDHNVPTTDRRLPIADAVSATQIHTLEDNCRALGITLFGMNDVRQGVVHIIGPEQGFTLPGMTIVCGDSHTSTHGAFGALAFGIGTSEVEHVLATQCLVQTKPKTMLIKVEGTLSNRCSAKDIVLAIIGKIGTAGGTGYVIEYAGSAIRALTMEGRMTLCNMSIEAGARAGMVAPDETTYAYVNGRPMAPKGELFERPIPSEDSSSRMLKSSTPSDGASSTRAICVGAATWPATVISARMSSNRDATTGLARKARAPACSHCRIDSGVTSALSTRTGVRVFPPASITRNCRSRSSPLTPGMCRSMMTAS